jgi:hypothetical protein
VVEGWLVGWSRGNMAGEARPAEAVLARAMVGDEELEEVFGGLGVGKASDEDGSGKLSSGSGSVDDALEGGLVDGHVVGVWGESGQVS